MSTEATATFETQKLPPLKLSEKIAYGLGDTAQNVNYGVSTGMLSYFYSDYMGMSTATIAMIMLVGRITDAFSDFIMGFVIEHTNTRWGKARPWIAIMIIPLSLGTILIFCCPPNWSYRAKTIYLFIVYNVTLSGFLTIMNLPYGTLNSLMTRDIDERSQLSAFRIGMSPIGRLISVSATLPLVKVMGNNQRAWIICMIIWNIIAAIMLVYTVVKCKERVVFKIEKQKVSFGKSIACLFRNPYFLGIMLFWGVTMGYSTFNGTILPYYCKYFLGSDSYYTILYTVELIVLCIAGLYTPAMSKKFGKRGSLLISIIGSMVAQMCIPLFGPRNFTLILVITVIRSLFIGVSMCTVFALMADTVEYHQYKFHLRQEGMIFSAGGLGSKFGPAIVSGIVGTLIANAGYIPSTGELVTQPESALAMINFIYLYGYIILWAFGLFVALMWRMGKYYDKMMAELAAREARGEW